MAKTDWDAAAEKAARTARRATTMSKWGISFACGGNNGDSKRASFGGECSTSQASREANLPAS